MSGSAARGSHKHATPRRRGGNRDSRSAYTAPGVSRPPVGDFPNIVSVPSAAQRFHHPSKTGSAPQDSTTKTTTTTTEKEIQEATSNTTILRQELLPSLSKESPAIGSSGEVLLQDIMTEMVTNPLEQKETLCVSRILSPPLNHDISYHPFGSKLFVNFWMPPGLPAVDKNWPDFRIKDEDILNAPSPARSRMLPDDLFKHANANPPTTAKPELEPGFEPMSARSSSQFRTQPSVNQLLEQSSLSSSAKASELRSRVRSSSWKPPPAFVPGVPFQSAIRKPDDENTPVTRPGTDYEITQEGSSMEIIGADPELWNASSPTQVAQIQPYQEYYHNPSDQMISGSPVVFMGSSNSAVAQLYPSMSRPQTMLVTGASSQDFQAEPRISANPGFNSAMDPMLALSGHYPPLQPRNTSTATTESILHVTNIDGNKSPSSSKLTTPSNALLLLNYPRGVYIRGLPTNITPTQLCANIRGGAIEHFKICLIDENKFDATVFFISTEAAKIYKQFTNSVGGIWWNPKEHPSSFPSFVSFIGPELCGHDRIVEPIRRAIEREGATRCITVYGIPEVLGIDGVLHRIQNALYPYPVDIESYTDTIATVGPTGADKKRTSTFNFSSINIAILVRKYFLETPMFNSVSTKFSPDECSGSVSELSAKWKRELHSGDLMRPSRRNLHGEYALGVNEAAGRSDGTSRKGKN